MKALAQAATRAAFEHLLQNPPSCLDELYKLILDNVLHQSVELVTLAKKILRILYDQSGPVSVSQLRSLLTSELVSIQSSNHPSRDITDEEVLEASLSSCKGFVISGGEGSLRLQFAHFSVRAFFEFHGLPA